jgi:hypothetical protein
VGRFSGRRRVLQFRFDSGVAENAARFVNLLYALAAAGGRIDYEHRVANCLRHQGKTPSHKYLE